MYRVLLVLKLKLLDSLLISAMSGIIWLITTLRHFAIEYKYSSFAPKKISQLKVFKSKATMQYLVIIAIAFFAAVNGLEFDRPCRFDQVSPNVKTGFQVPAYLGTWYEVKRYEAQNQTGLDCVNARYSLSSDGSVVVDNTGWTSQGRFIQFIGRAEVAFPNQVPLPGKLNVTFFPGQPVANYWVLSTDYVNYAVVWSCRPLANNRSNESAWVLSRTLNETVAVQQRYEEVLRSNGILINEMRITGRDFDGCARGSK